MKILKNFVFNHAGPIGIAAMVTWAVVSFIIVFDFPTNLGQGSLIGIVVLLAIYFVGLQISWLRDTSTRRINESGLLLMMVCIIGLSWLTPQYTYLILMVIFAGVLAYFFSIVTSTIVILLLYGFTLIPAIYYWQYEFAFLVSITYLSFTAFAFFASYTAQRESQAREDLAIANKQLLATQQLLTESAINDERLRISRDLHDTIGHHLTALSLQLEVAKKLTADKALDHVEQAQAISKLLLSDVRDVVANMRAVPQLDIRASLQQLAESAKAKVDLSIDPELSLHNSRVAETLFRLVQEIVTNCNRHSHTGKLSISLQQDGKAWLLNATDMGDNPVSITEGTGIQGMRERVEQLDGRFELQTNNGLNYRISLPKHD